MDFFLLLFISLRSAYGADRAWAHRSAAHMDYTSEGLFYKTKISQNYPASQVSATYYSES